MPSIRTHAHTHKDLSLGTRRQKNQGRWKVVFDVPTWAHERQETQNFQFLLLIQ